jgi:hypothetical protein
MKRVHESDAGGMASVRCGPGAKLLTVTPRLLPAAILTWLAVQGTAQPTARPHVPEKINPPAAEKVILEVHASGSQIYTCQQDMDGKYGWALKAPDAELRDEQGDVVGRHYAGPTWKHQDGSEVTGKVVARVDSPDPDSIPWLLLNATAHAGNGVLSSVTSIQRIRTKGGQPPPAIGCNASQARVEAKSSYSADYYFYAPAK